MTCGGRRVRAMTSSIRPSWSDIVKGYVLLPHVVPIIAVLVATSAFAFVASGGWPNAWDLVFLLGAMLGGQLAVGAVNELVDAELDSVARPSKPIPAGLVSPSGAITMAAAGLLLMALCSLRFSVPAFLLCAVGNGVGVAYSVWFKRSAWSWFPYVVAIPLIPIWVWTALDSFPRELLLIYPIGIPAVISLQIAQSMPDIASDQASGVQTLAVILGEERAPWICWGLVICSIAVAAGTVTWVTTRPMWALIACLVSFGIVMGNAVLWRRERRWGVMKAFPMMAAAVVVLGVGWTFAILGK